MNTEAGTGTSVRRYVETWCKALKLSRIAEGTLALVDVMEEEQLAKP